MPPANLQQEISRAASMMNAGRLDAAEAATRKLFKKNPRNIGVVRLLSLICRRSGKLAEAVQLIGKAQKIAPGDPQVWIDAVQLAKIQGKFPEAVRFARKAGSVAPKSDEVFGLLAMSLVWNGDFDDALKMLQPRVEAGRLSPLMLQAFVESHYNLKGWEEVVRIASAIPAGSDAKLGLDHRRAIAMMHASALERLDRQAEAVEVVRQMHAGTSVAFEPASAKSLNDQIRGIWSADRFASLDDSPFSRSEVPVFILGMARSGTTLLERIISAHPGAHGVGESPILGDAVTTELKLGRAGASGVELHSVATLEGAPLERIREAALDDLARLAGRHERIASKDLRLTRTAGIAGRCFPGARVINLTRAAEDVAVSIWSHAFRLDGMGWATRLDWIAMMIAEHERMVEHWRKVLPNPWLDVVYEDLARDPENEIRRVIEFLDLPWDDACLRHQESRGGAIKPTHSEYQVRESVNTRSIGRAAGYPEVMAEFRRHLEAARSEG